MIVKELTLLERLYLALYYSISENHKEDLKFRIKYLEHTTEIIYGVTEQGQIRWLPGF